MKACSFVDLAAEDRHVVNKTFREPQSKFLLGVLDAIGAMDDVASHFDAVCATNASRVSSQGVGGADNLAALLDNVLTFKSNGNNGAAQDVLDESRKEGLRGEISIVLFSKLLADVHKLETAENVALADESVENGGDQIALDAIRLDHDVSGLQL